MPQERTELESFLTRAGEAIEQAEAVAFTDGDELELFDQEAQRARVGKAHVIDEYVVELDSVDMVEWRHENRFILATWEDVVRTHVTNQYELFWDGIRQRIVVTVDRVVDVSGG